MLIRPPHSLEDVATLAEVRYRARAARHFNGGDVVVASQHISCGVEDFDVWPGERGTLVPNTRSGGGVVFVLWDKHPIAPVAVHASWIDPFVVPNPEFS